MIPNPWVILGVAGTWLVSLALCSWLFYARGVDDNENAHTKMTLVATAKALTDSKTRQNDGAQAAQEHDEHEDEIQRLYALLRSRPGAVPIPPATDPFVPVWFVRMHDRAASGDAGGDPYPGKSDANPSDVRLSQALAMLISNYEGCQINRSRLADIIALKPVLPAVAPPPAPTHNPDLFHRLNPF